MAETRVVRINHEEGIHARPASLIIQVVNKYGIDLTIRKGDLEIKGDSIMSILMLEATKGSELELIAEGENADIALQEIEAIINDVS